MDKRVFLDVMSLFSQSNFKHSSCLKSFLRYIHSDEGMFHPTLEPFQPLKRKAEFKSAESAVSVIKSNDCIYIHGAAATPTKLIQAMTRHAKSKKLKNVRVFHIHTEGKLEYLEPEYKGIFRDYSFFMGSNCREAVNEGRADYIPIFLGEIPLMFHRKIISPDVALVQVCPPDRHGYCSLGTSVDCTRAALIYSRNIIGLVNPNMPRTIGDGMIHSSHFDALVEGNDPLPEAKIAPMTEVEEKIGKYIADDLVEDGATLQMGIGAIPNVVLSKLVNHKHLGIHSEMFSDGVVSLVEKGCVTNHLKIHNQGKTIATFLIGSRKLYDFVNNNPSVVMLEVSYVNNPSVIARNPKMTAINSCIEVDLAGQVAADAIGTKLYSGIGGQMDFLRGAAISADGLGKPILAMPSVTKTGESKITPFLKKGAGVVTTRGHVYYIVTEWGIAFLFGKSLRQRAFELINIAHPDHREALEKAAFERLKCMPSRN